MHNKQRNEGRIDEKKNDKVDDHLLYGRNFDS